VNGGDAAREAVTAADFSAREVAVTERRVDGIRSRSTGSATGRARITDYERERVAVKTNSAQPALLVLTDSWFPGWKAKVDGARAPVERVDYVIRGVKVPAGTHEVEFTYEPASWRAGWILSLLALLAIACASTIGWRRYRRERGHPGPTTGMFES
jgi:uncharacterized membrane protein YfhO